MAVHPTEDKLLVFAGDKWGRLGLFDVMNTDERACVSSYRPHNTPRRRRAEKKENRGKGKDEIN